PAKWGRADAPRDRTQRKAAVMPSPTTERKSIDFGRLARLSNSAAKAGDAELRSPDAATTNSTSGKRSARALDRMMADAVDLASDVASAVGGKRLGDQVRDALSGVADTVRSALDRDWRRTVTDLRDDW